MQEILKRRQKYLDELKTKQEEYTKLLTQRWTQAIIADGKYNEYSDLKVTQETNRGICQVLLGVPSLLGTIVLPTVALCKGEFGLVPGCVGIGFACLGFVAWKGVPMYYEWKYTERIDKAETQYRKEQNKMDELNEKSDKIASEMNQIKSDISDCDKEIRVMKCLMKLMNK